MSDAETLIKQLRVAAPYARVRMNEEDLTGWPIRFLLLEAAAQIEELQAELKAVKGE